MLVSVYLGQKSFMVSAEDDNWPKHVLKLHVQKLSYVPQKKKKKERQERGLSLILTMFSIHSKSRIQKRDGKTDCRDQLLSLLEHRILPRFSSFSLSLSLPPSFLSFLFFCFYSVLLYPSPGSPFLLSFVISHPY